MEKMNICRGVASKDCGVPSRTGLSGLASTVTAGLLVLALVPVAYGNNGNGNGNGNGGNGGTVEQTSTHCSLANASITMENGVEVDKDAADCIGILLGSNGGATNFDDYDLNNALLDDGGPEHITSSLGKVWDPGAFEQTGWEEKAKVEEGGNLSSSNPLSFSVTPNSPTTGQLTWTTSTALNGTWILRVKQSSEAVLWLFTGLKEATGGTVVLQNLQSEGWSNIALISGTDQTPGNGNETEVPVPATLFLLGIGLVMSNLVARRRAR